MSNRKIGKVKWFNNKKGFGFLVPDDGSADVFVHMTAVEAAGMQTLRDGEKIEFEVGNDRGKSKAINLKKVA